MNSLFEKLKQHARRKPAHTALRSADKSLGYFRLWQDVRQIARALREANVGSLGLYLDNGIEWIVLDLAAAYAGIQIVPLPWFFSDQQLQHAIEQGAVDHIACAEQVPAGVTAQGFFSLYNNSRLVSIGDAQSRIETLPSPTTTKLSFTSGSTGQPRGISIPAGLVEQTTCALAQIIPGEHIHNHLSLLPYATLLENIAGVYLPLMLGRTVHAESAQNIGLTPDLRIEPRQLIQTFNRIRPDSMILTPDLLRLVCALAEHKAIDPGCLKFVAVGGARVGDALLQRAESLQIPVYEGYGLTEFGSVATLNTPQHRRPGSVGKPLPGVDAVVSDSGEICLETRIKKVENGQTETFRVATGDYGSIDQNGYLHVQGRRSNLIVLSTGRNVSPEWVESEFQNSPVIDQCFVFSENGSDLTALIFSVDTKDREIDSAVLNANMTLPPFARVKVWYRLTVPFSRENRMLTANGRLRREQIRHQLETLIHPQETRVKSTAGDRLPHSNQEKIAC